MRTYLILSLLITNIIFAQVFDSINSVDYCDSLNFSTNRLDTSENVNNGSNEEDNENKDPIENFLIDLGLSSLSASIVTLIFIPIIVTLMTFFFKNSFQNRKEKKQEIKKFCTLLVASKNEMNFYITKFKQLSSETETIINKIKNAERYLIPTYSLYPNQLEIYKVELNKFDKNPKIVMEVNYCYFELSHINDRLTETKRELRSKFKPFLQISNLTGFKGLIDNNIEKYQEIIEMIDEELKKNKKYCQTE